MIHRIEIEAVYSLSVIFSTSEASIVAKQSGADSA